MDTASLLLEIGTEELPPHFCREALVQWRGLIQASLEAWGFGDPPIQPFATPRRLAVVVQDLPLKQDDLTEDLKGPPAAHAFEGGAPTGAPTRAAVGFARRCGVPVEALEIRTTGKGPFVFARVSRSGCETEALLCEAVPTWIAALQGKRFMRWGTGTQRFSRPIRWLVALLDDRLLPIQLDNTCPPVVAQACSRGLRGDEEHHNLAIPTANAYEPTLRNAGIILDRDERKATIAKSIRAKAAELGAIPQLCDDLLGELTDLVETPQLLVGTIDERFLSLPAEVTAMEMVAHQRYVPLFRVAATDPLALDARDVLDPRFLMIANASPTADPNLIIRGNERVLRARLADGDFFYRQDRSKSLELDYRPQLYAVTFAEGLEKLGLKSSVGDRVERLTEQAVAIANHLQLGAADADNDLHIQTRLVRAAELCKADLVTQMVGEFPELQGIMGAKYALAAGEDRQVAEAIQEHYLPRHAGDALPQSDLGRLLALAERLELLISIFLTGHRPSGSADPFALRRAGNGLMQILLDSGWHLNLAELLEDALVRNVQLTGAYPIDDILHGGNILSQNREPEKQLRTELLAFLHQRLRAQLAEQPLDHDAINAVASDTADAEHLLADPVDVAVRAQLLQEWRQAGDLAPVQAVVKRAKRLVDKGEWPTEQRPPDDCVDPADYVDPELFTSPVEQRLLSALNKLKGVVDDRREGRDQARQYYHNLAEELSGMAPQLAAFFDGEQSVMVMVDDPAVRRNRLNLLAVLCNQARVIGDFSQLQG